MLAGQWVFYNVRNPAYSVDQYAKPAELTDSEWLSVKEHNPDDRSLVPVVVVGFDGLLSRVKAQDDCVARLQDCCKVSCWAVRRCRRTRSLYRVHGCTLSLSNCGWSCRRRRWRL